MNICLIGVSLLWSGHSRLPKLDDTRYSHCIRLLLTLYASNSCYDLDFLNASYLVVDDITLPASGWCSRGVTGHECLLLFCLDLTLRPFFQSTSRHHQQASFAAHPHSKFSTLRILNSEFMLPDHKVMLPHPHLLILSEYSVHLITYSCSSIFQATCSLSLSLLSLDLRGNPFNLCQPCFSLLLP